MAPQMEFQVIASSAVMWKASPSAAGCPSRPTKPTAKSRLWVIVHSEVPSPGTTTPLPSRIRWMAVQPPSKGTIVWS